MQLTTQGAISPVDGRYRKQTEPLSRYFSESALIRYRIMIEVKYFIALTKVPLPSLKNVSAECIAALENLASEFTEAQAQEVKEIEKVTNHDVKAVEYFIKQSASDQLKDASEFIHFGLTSQDINNTAIPLSIKDAIAEVMLPELKSVRDQLAALSEQWRSIPLLARTHGQPASPTGLGKEIAVFVNRLDAQTALMKQIPYSAKFGGATGNFNAHYAAYPNTDWEMFGDTFVGSLGLSRSKITTQIEHYDNLAALFDSWKRTNTILLDLCRDIWTYISMNYFTQQVKKGEVGSSAMPHKVNPIDFENAEGNFGFANAIFAHLSEKLPVSRLQRDLTDSTVLRNVGIPFAHTLIALKSLQKGLGKIQVNESTIAADLEDNWAVVAEAIQTVLRREGYPNPYEALKDLTRTGEKISQHTIREFISNLKVDDSIKTELASFTPSNYVGMAMRFKI
jgi:adenylosuccinate lyase